MKTNRIFYSAAVLVILLLLFAWYQASTRDQGTVDSLLLQDESATPAPFSLVTVQEQPVFQNDEQGRPVGMDEDQSDKPSAGDKPVTVEEVAPPQ